MCKTGFLSSLLMWTLPEDLIRDRSSGRSILGDDWVLKHGTWVWDPRSYVNLDVKAWVSLIPAFLGQEGRQRLENILEAWGSTSLLNAMGNRDKRDPVYK